MAEFGTTSRARLSECNTQLQRLMNRVVQIRDISVVCGRRGKDEQNRLYESGESKLRWPDGKHNVEDPNDLADAVDIVPWPEQYSDPMTMIHVAGIVMGVGAEMGIRLRWGGDWNRNSDLRDQTFIDLWHFEIAA
jgi:peptidoglycan L-alanyl-D-glutamate endopeptidase CwlK